jgi:hypothetical protein
VPVADPLPRFLLVEPSVKQAREAQVLECLLWVTRFEQCVSTRISDTEHRTPKDGFEALAFILTALAVVHGHVDNWLRSPERLAHERDASLSIPVMVCTRTSIDLNASCTAAS